METNCLNFRKQSFFSGQNFFSYSTWHVYTNIYPGHKRSTVRNWWFSSLFIFLKNQFYLFEKQRRLVCTLVSFPNALNSLSWPRSGTGQGQELRIQVLVLHVGGRDPIMWDITCCLPKCPWAEARIGNWSWSWTQALQYTMQQSRVVALLPHTPYFSGRTGRRL